MNQTELKTVVKELAAREFLPTLNDLQKEYGDVNGRLIQAMIVVNAINEQILKSLKTTISKKLFYR